MSILPKKIKSHNTAHEFYYWIADNPQIDNIQGFNLLRMNNNNVYGLQYGSYPDDYHIFDIDYIWNERKMLNDWIDKIINSH